MYASFEIPDNYSGPCSAKDNEDINGVARVGRIYNSFYQFIPIYLIILAIVFYLPRYIWVKWEGGLMKFLGKGRTTRLIEGEQEKLDDLVEVKFVFIYARND